MSGSAPRWLLALAAGTALLGLVLKLSDVRGPAPGHPPAPAAHEAAKAPAAAAARRGAEDGGRLAAAPDTASDPARDAVPPPSDAELLAAEAPRMRTARAADGGDGASLHRVRNRRRAERNGIHRYKGGDLVAGAVGDQAAGQLESRDAHGGGTAAAAPAAVPTEAAPPPAQPASDVTYSSGEDRTFATDKPVEITDIPKLAGSQGSLSFWLQPGWSDGNQDDASLLEIGDGRLRIVKNVDFLRFEWTDEAGTDGGIGAPIAEWKTGEWHAVTTTWNGTTVSLYIDGKLVSEKSDVGQVALPDDSTLVIGSDFPENRPVAPGTIGRVDVRRRELTAGEVANQFATGTGGTTQGGAASGKR